MRLTNINLDGITLAVEATEPAPPANVGFGSIVLTVAVAALMVWMGYLWLNSRRARRIEETPSNLQPGISDDELESTKLSRILSSAVVSAAVLAAVWWCWTDASRETATTGRPATRSPRQRAVVCDLAPTLCCIPLTTSRRGRSSFKITA